MKSPLELAAHLSAYTSRYRMARGNRDNIMHAADALRRMEIALRNVRMLAKRMRKTDPENAAHLLRFVASTGIEDSFLRDNAALLGEEGR